MGDFRKLLAWQRAQALAVLVYKTTLRLPPEERFGLSAQMRRSALSVSSNLAEGCGRKRDSELRRFIRISLGSLAELECQVMLAAELTFVSPSTAESLANEIGRIRGMLDQLHARLTARAKTRPPSDPRPQTKTLDPRP